MLEIGSAVSNIAVGGHVMLLYNSCGDCKPCSQHKNFRCVGTMGKTSVLGVKTDSRLSNEMGNLSPVASLANRLSAIQLFFKRLLASI